MKKLNCYIFFSSLSTKACDIYGYYNILLVNVLDI